MNSDVTVDEIGLKRLYGIYDTVISLGMQANARTAGSARDARLIFQNRATSQAGRNRCNLPDSANPMLLSNQVNFSFEADSPFGMNPRRRWGDELRQTIYQAIGRTARLDHGFDGPGAEFVVGQQEAQQESGGFAGRFLPMRIHLMGDNKRAFQENPAQIIQRIGGSGSFKHRFA